MPQFNFDFSVFFPASPKTVFDYVSEPAQMSTWTPGVKLRRIVNSPLKGGNPNDVGSVRIVETSTGNFYETITGYEDPNFFEYRITKGSVIRNHVGKITIEPEKKGVRLSWKIFYDPKVPFTGSLIRMLAKLYFVANLHLLSLKIRLGR